MGDWPSEDQLADHFAWIGIDAAQAARFQYTELIRDFMLRSPQVSTGETVARASPLISDLISACQRNDPDGPPPPDGVEWYRSVWRHRDLKRAFQEGPKSTEACPIYREGVVAVATDYLAQDLRSPKFEALVLDALIAMEVYGYGEELKRSPSQFSRSPFRLLKVMAELEAYDDASGNMDKLYWHWIKSNLKFAAIKASVLYGAPAGIIWLSLVNQWEVPAALAAVFLAFVVGYDLVSWVWRNLRALFGSPSTNPMAKAFELHGRMLQAYREIGSPAASPRRIREILARVSDEGAAWEPVVFSLLDDMIERSAARWGVR